jgi:outer membrane immunogenic protein
MKILLISGLAFGALIAPAAAADMPIKAPPPLPVYTWTGLYLGIDAGAGAAKSSWCTNATLGFNGCADGDSVSQSHTSATIGGLLGYRYQWGPLVLGAEGSANIFNNTVTSAAGLPAIFSNRFRTTNFDDLYSVTGQLGYAMGTLLFYGKGGWAGAGVRYDASDINPPGFDLSASTNVSGYTAGGGLDYMITPTLIVGVEYDYYKFNVGAFNGLANTGGAVTACSFCNITESVQTVLARAIVKFQ